MSAGAAAGGEEEGITIGSQVWMKKSLNVGTMVDDKVTQTNNGTIEKYCYNNDAANCKAYGGLYQWNEAMQYSRAPGAQGICPAGWHIPTDNDWKTLEVSLGMAQAQADGDFRRGSDQGTQLKPGGSSGLDVPLAGRLFPSQPFVDLGSRVDLWSSSESYPFVNIRSLESGYTSVGRYWIHQTYAVSVRCLKD